jgi:hypothetical protein
VKKKRRARRQKKKRKREGKEGRTARRQVGKKLGRAGRQEEPLFCGSVVLLRLRRLRSCGQREINRK